MISLLQYLLIRFVITRLLDSSLSMSRSSGNLPQASGIIPENRNLECEPIYATDSLTGGIQCVFIISVYSNALYYAILHPEGLSFKIKNALSSASMQSPPHLVVHSPFDRL